MKTLATAFLLSLVWVGCSSEPSQPQHAKAADPVGNSEEGVGLPNQAIDPVSGETVWKDSAWSVLYNGNWYFFTSQDHEKQFATDPTAFVTEDGRMKHDLEAK